MEYIVVQSTSKRDFENLVNSYLSNGWTLQGGISVNDEFYYQAMIYSEFEFPSYVTTHNVKPYGATEEAVPNPFRFSLEISGGE